MTPNVWGKCAWDFIHLITLGYPTNPTESDMYNYSQFIYDLQNVLPCSKCRANLRRHIQSLPLTYDSMKNRDSLVKWGIDLHNIVNHELGKPMLSYDEAIEYINNIGVKKTQSLSGTLFILILIIVIILVAYFLIKKLKK